MWYDWLVVVCYGDESVEIGNGQGAVVSRVH